MHRFLTAEEKKWVHTDKFGWPIKENCPEEIRKSIEKKKNDIKKQSQWISERNKK